MAESRHGKTSKAGRVQVESIELQVKQVADQKMVILIELKTSSSQLGCGSGWIDPYFSHDFFFFFKENNMYLSFEKSCNKLLDVK